MSVIACGSIVANSFHSNGVETRPVGRTEYAEAMVLSRAFWL